MHVYVCIYIHIYVCIDTYMCIHYIYHIHNRYKRNRSHVASASTGFHGQVSAECKPGQIFSGNVAWCCNGGLMGLMALIHVTCTTRGAEFL